MNFLCPGPSATHCIRINKYPLYLLGSLILFEHRCCNLLMPVCWIFKFFHSTVWISQQNPEQLNRNSSTEQLRVLYLKLTWLPFSNFPRHEHHLFRNIELLKSRHQPTSLNNSAPNFRFSTLSPSEARRRRPSCHQSSFIFSNTYHSQLSSYIHPLPEYPTTQSNPYIYPSSSTPHRTKS